LKVWVYRTVSGPVYLAFVIAGLCRTKKSGSQ
jgi:hypothetical protein